MRLLKLNNRGVTAVEILVCFVLMVIMVSSMYGTVVSYKNRQNIESAKEQILAYKNLLTKEIQDDLIKRGLTDAKITDSLNAEVTGNVDKTYTVELTFRDGSKKTLKVEALYAKDFGSCTTSDVTCQNDKDDYLAISYGVEGTDNYTVYKLPDLGYGYNGNTYSTNSNCSSKGSDGCKIYDFRINNIIVDTTNNIFSFYVGFSHPNLGTRYGIDIVCPINYF